MNTCPHCQSISLIVASGKGPHHGRLSCADCDKWIKWLSKREVEARGGFQVEQLNLLGGAQ